MDKNTPRKIKDDQSLQAAEDIMLYLQVKGVDTDNIHPSAMAEIIYRNYNWEEYRKQRDI